MHRSKARRTPVKKKIVPPGDLREVWLFPLRENCGVDASNRGQLREMALEGLPADAVAHDTAAQ